MTHKQLQLRPLVTQWRALDWGWSFWVIPYRSKQSWAFECLHQQSLAVNPLRRVGSFLLPGAVPSDGHSYEPSCQLRISRIIDKSSNTMATPSPYTSWTTNLASQMNVPDLPQTLRKCQRVGFPISLTLKVNENSEAAWSNTSTSLRV